MQIVRTTIQGIYLVVSLVYLTSLVSCTIEKKTKRFTVITKNESGHPLNIQAFSGGQLVEDIDLLDSESGFECTYYFEIFSDYNCDYDLIVFQFSNMKGYLLHSPELGFSEERYESLYVFNNGKHQLTLTQSDYENAHELPE